MFLLKALHLRGVRKENCVLMQVFRRLLSVVLGRQDSTLLCMWFCGHFFPQVVKQWSFYRIFPSCFINLLRACFWVMVSTSGEVPQFRKISISSYQNNTVLTITMYSLSKDDIYKSPWLYYLKVHTEQTNFFNLWLTELGRKRGSGSNDCFFKPLVSAVLTNIRNTYNRTAVANKSWLALALHLIVWEDWTNHIAV